METNKKVYLSWGAIILAMIVFWPVGLILLYLKYNENKKVFFNFKGKIKLIIGICLILFGVIGFFTEIEKKSEDIIIGIILGIFFISIGAYIFKKGMENIKEGKIYEKIVYMVEFLKVENVKEIAKELQIDVDTAKYYLSKTIKLGLCDKDIIYEDGKIINKKRIIEENERIRKQRAVKCNCCGGITRVMKDEYGTCDYCGMELPDGK